MTLDLLYFAEFKDPVDIFMQKARVYSLMELHKRPKMTVHELEVALIDRPLVRLLLHFYLELENEFSQKKFISG